MSTATSPKKLKCGRPLPKQSARNLHAREDDHWKSILSDYGERKGLKRSDSRAAIADIIMNMHGHFSAQDVVRQVQDKHVSIGAATVYRTIALLHDAGLLRETLIDEEGSTIYEISDGDHHDHIVCVDCGQIMEFYDERIEVLQKQINEGLKFAEIRHRHVIYARCEYLEQGRR